MGVLDKRSQRRRRVVQQFLPGRYKGKTTRKRVRVRARVRAHTPCRLSPQLPTRGAPRGAGWALQLGWFGGTRAMALGLEEAALHLKVTSPCLRSVTLLSPCHLRAAAGHRAGPPAPWGQWDPSQTDELPLDIGWPQRRWPHIPPCSPGSKEMTAPSIKGMLPHCPQWKWGTVMFEGGEGDHGPTRRAVRRGWVAAGWRVPLVTVPPAVPRD